MIFKRNKTIFAVGLILAFALVLSAVQPTWAASIVVDTTIDVIDAGGGCGAVTLETLPGPDGLTSFREAICAVNNRTGQDTISFDIPDTCVAGVCTILLQNPLPPLTIDHTRIDGYTQPGSAVATETSPAVILIELDGSELSNSHGLTIYSDSNRILGLAIKNFPWSGISLDGASAFDNQISGNHLGVDASGMVAEPNGQHGVEIVGGAQGNVIGGRTVADRNVISGNEHRGVLINGYGDNEIIGNYIGVDASGITAIPNGHQGIMLQNESMNNVIGGDSVEERNIISGNTQHGISISSGGDNVITGNFIGTDASGMSAVPNGFSGVYIANSSDNWIGSDSEAEMNFISGNTEYGIMITGSITGTQALRNWAHNNAIGLNYDYEPLGNGIDGIHLSVNAVQNSIGPDNWIAYNGSDGVDIDTPTAIFNRIYENSIFSNVGNGIDLTNGSNEEIEPPVILSAPDGVGTVTGTACSQCSVELFFNPDDDGEGKYYHGRTTADVAGNWSMAIPYQNYPYLTATATDEFNNTSEFSAVYMMEIPVFEVAPSFSPDRTIAAPGEILTYTLSLTNTGTIDAPAIFTNTIPISTTWIEVTSVTTGTLEFQSESNLVTWTGTLAIGDPVEVSYQVQLDENLTDGHTISNIGYLDIGVGQILDLIAEDVTIDTEPDVFYIYLPIIYK